MRRLIVGAVLLWFVATLAFVLIQVAPGNPVDIFTDPRIPTDQIKRIEAFFGFDQPIHTQYLRWLGNVVTAGDFGVSFFHLAPPGEVIRRNLAPTVLLAAAALLIGYSLGVFAGLWTAQRPDSLADRLLRLLSLTIYSVPTFWLGLMLILLFSGVLGIAPASGIQSPFAEDLPLLRRALDTLAHLALPALTLGLPIATYVARLLRSALLDTLEQPFIRNARARGLSETRILWGHALRNCLGPLVQALGILLPALLGGAYLVEYVFSWPGLGTVSLRAIESRDYPLVLATTLYTGGLVILGNLGADLLHAWIDPRVHEIEME